MGGPQTFFSGSLKDIFGDPQNRFLSSPRGMHLTCFKSLRHMGKGRMWLIHYLQSTSCSPLNSDIIVSDALPVDGDVQSPMRQEGGSSAGGKTTIRLTDPKTTLINTNTILDF